MNFNEKLLCHIWDAQHLQQNLETVSGKPLQVVYPGRWNTDRGPDFHDVIINIDGTVFRGDAEVHINTNGWKAHGHDEDIYYNKVILHIVYEHNGFTDYTITEDGTSIEILELKHFLDEDLTKLIKKYEGATLYPDFCRFFAGLDIATLKLILSRLGSLRMEKKVKRFGAELFFCDFNQLLYQGLFEAAGYSKNRFNTLQIAIQFPYSDLKQWKSEGMTLAEMQSIFICGSKLDERTPMNERNSLLNELIGHYDKQSYTKKKFNVDWQLFRIRPSNHPLTRILQHSILIYDSFDSSLLDSVIKAFSVPINDESHKLITKNLHNLLIGQGTKHSYKIGNKHLDVLVVNIVIPIVILFGEKMGYQKLVEAAWQIYREHRALTTNYIEDQLKKKYLSDPQQKLIGQKAIYQQGLLRLYTEYCQHHNCDYCEKNKKALISDM